MNNTYCIIVDPFSGGKYLAKELKNREISCIAVLSNDVPDNFSAGFDRSQYAHIIQFSDYDNSVVQLAKHLSSYNIVGVIPGLETGLQLTDLLAKELKLPGNNPETTAYRKDKFVMQQAIQAYGLNSIQQDKFKNHEDLKLALSKWNKFPVVVKPTNSAGSDNVHICYNKQDILQAAQRIFTTSSLFNELNNDVLVQEFIEGEEWVVDLVTCDGRIKVTNITNYEKVRSENGHFIYRHSNFQEPDYEKHQTLIEYAVTVNKAVGVDYGAAHIEVMMSDNGPVLIEINSRMHGGDAVEKLNEFSKISQLSLNVDSYIDKPRFMQRAQQDVHYGTRLRAHFLISKNAGQVQSVITQQELDKIASVDRHYLPQVHSDIVVTTSLTDAPGYIWLINESKEGLENDQNLLIELEDNGKLYTLV